MNKFETLVHTFVCFRKMETEIVSMTAGILNGSDECVGFLTSGGTESNLMAVKTYLNRAKKMYPTIKNPEIVSCTSKLVFSHYNTEPVCDI